MQQRWELTVSPYKTDLSAEASLPCMDAVLPTMLHARLVDQSMGPALKQEIVALS